VWRPSDALFFYLAYYYFRIYFYDATLNSHCALLPEPKSKALYLAIFFVHFSVSLVNCSLIAYLNLIHDGEIKIAKAPAPTFPKLCHSIPTKVIQVLGLRCKYWFCIVCNEILRFNGASFSKSIMCSNNFMTHLLILPNKSLLPNMSWRGWFVRTRTLCASK
jgi:hypothetical protein